MPPALQVLKNIKATVEARNSVCHSAAVFANAVMHAGTTVDTFLRDNLDWLARATNWAKFSATAGERQLGWVGGCERGGGGSSAHWAKVGGTEAVQLFV
jgi:hypothetical protein